MNAAQPTPQPQDADRYWDYLMSADSSPITFLLVAVPAIIGVSIVVFAICARWFRRKQEQAWLDNEINDPAPVTKDLPHGS